MYVVYKTTCKITNKFYIGTHKISNENEPYFGSGKLLKESLKLYGESTHIVEIIECFEDRKSAIKLEHSLIAKYKKENLDKLLNINDGGYSWDRINELGKNVYEPSEEILASRRRQLEAGRQTIRNKLLTDAEYRSQYCQNVSDGMKKYCAIHGAPFQGKSHSDETKKILSDIGKTYVGSKNSQYGTFWITNGEINKKWKDSFGDIPEGFSRGRKC